ncbi:UDP-glycosyltransferase 76E6 [Trichinella pseudospiralis]
MVAREHFLALWKAPACREMNDRRIASFDDVNPLFLWTCCFRSREPTLLKFRSKIPVTCNGPIPRAGSSASSTGLLTRPSLFGDGPSTASWHNCVTNRSVVVVVVKVELSIVVCVFFY